MNTPGKIKVVFFDEAVAFGGSVVVLSHLFRHIDRSRFTPLIVSCLDDESLDNLFEPADILCKFRRNLDYVSRSRWMERCPGKSRLVRKLWAYLFTIAQIGANFWPNLRMFITVAMQRPDLIHVNNGREGLRIAKWLGIPLVFHMHGVAPELEWRKAPLIWRAIRFISISKYITEQGVAFGVAPERVVDIPNPAPVFTPNPEGRWAYLAKYGIKEGQTVIAHVGRLLRWKGQLEFLQAFCRSFAGREDVVCLIVGDDVEGFTESYRAVLDHYVAENGLSRQVVFAGHVSDILPLMSYVDLVVHSSIDPEPFGLVITEAMAAGVAVVASNLGAPGEIIEQGRTGMLIDPRNTGQFAETLARLIDDPALRREIAAAGKRMVDVRYSPVAFARRVEQVYEDALAACGAVKPA